MDKDFLMHHGIKGQKWGVKNGPPYPLKGVSVRKNRYRLTKAGEEEKTIKKVLLLRHYRMIKIE